MLMENKTDYVDRLTDREDSIVVDNFDNKDNIQFDPDQDLWGDSDDEANEHLNVEITDGYASNNDEVDFKNIFASPVSATTKSFTEVISPTNTVSPLAQFSNDETSADEVDDKPDASKQTKTFKLKALKKSVLYSTETVKMSSLDVEMAVRLTIDLLKHIDHFRYHRLKRKLSKVRVRLI